MLVALALLLQAAAPSPTGSGCPGQGAFMAAVQLALDAKKGGSLAAAKAQVDPLVAACDVATSSGFAARALRADIASSEKDWAGVREALTGVTFERPSRLTATIGFLKVRADQELGDAAAFTRDRDALLAANARGLAARGREIETFKAAAFTVSAFESPVTQGPFRRLFEFVARPDDPAALPMTLDITDDLNASRIAADMAAKEGKPAPRIFFTDLYVCSGHSTLAPPPAGPDGGAPTYAQVKPMAAKVFADGGKAPSSSSLAVPGTGCPAANWLLPGLDPPPAAAG